MNNSMVAHLWAHEQEESALGSNFFFEGTSIYSYGHHFEVGRIVKNKQGKKAYLINEDYYSVTTSKHQCYVRNAIPTWAMVFSVGDNISDTGNMRFVASKLESIKKSIEKYKRAKTEAYGEITSEEVPIWTSVCGEDKSKYVRLATEEEKKSFAERIANTENLKKAGIIKQYLSEYEYLLTKEKKCDFKPFDQVSVRASNLGNWNLHLFARVREEEYKYECLGGLRYKECIPYQGNEHLLGTNKSK